MATATIRLVQAKRVPGHAATLEWTRVVLTLASVVFELSQEWQNHTVVEVEDSFLLVGDNGNVLVQNHMAEVRKLAMGTTIGRVEVLSQSEQLEEADSCLDPTSGDEGKVCCTRAEEQ